MRRFLTFFHSITTWFFYWDFLFWNLNSFKQLNDFCLILLFIFIIYLFLFTYLLSCYFFLFLLIRRERNGIFRKIILNFFFFNYLKVGFLWEIVNNFYRIPRCLFVQGSIFNFSFFVFCAIKYWVISHEMKIWFVIFNILRRTWNSR